jgi:2-polyprenyl-3-methyl-5-hydroxy-6-metoxy-1,4-benzoquinol methylase
MPGKGSIPAATPETLNAVARELRSLREPRRENAIFERPRPVDAGDGFEPRLSQEIEQFLRTVSNPDHAVGHMPPEPPTWRGRTGASLVRIVKRTLFWYTEQINEIFGKAGGLFRQVAERLSYLERQGAGQRQREEEAARQVDSLSQATRTLRANTSELEDALSGARREMAAMRDSLPREFQRLLQAAVEQERASIDARLEKERVLLEVGLNSKIADSDSRLAEANASIADLVAKSGEATGKVANLDASLAEANGKVADLAAQLVSTRESLRRADLLVHQTRAQLYAQASRISLLMRRFSGEGANSAPRVPESEDDTKCAELEEVYVEFENQFRGTRADIKERVSEYLPTVTGKKIGTPQMPILDLGCGRGEWLEVLAENGMTASGVDSNESCVRECSTRGLTVHAADAIRFLAQLPEQSQGAVTAFHVVEHMPFRALVNLLDEAIRVLKRGGLLILETPNPANLIVGAHTFYLDPTHIRPLPADLLRFVVESRGFCGVEVRPLHPFPESFRIAGLAETAAATLNDLLYGPRDYAIVAERA